LSKLSNSFSESLFFNLAPEKGKGENGSGLAVGLLPTFQNNLFRKTG